MSITRTLVFAAASAAATAAPPVAADNNQFVVTAIAASDWLYHGTTETDDSPTLGINTEWHDRRGFYLGVQAHQAKERGARQRQRAVMGYVGYELPDAAGWRPSVALARREFLDSSKNWQFTEFSLDFAHRRGFGLRVDYSPNYYAHNTRSIAVEARYLRDFGLGWYGRAAAGRVELSNERWLDHHYAQLTLGRSVGAVNVELVGHWNNQGSSRAFGRENYSDPSVALQLGYRLW